ncbi:MAG: hypothetical protein AB1488_09540 [Nitrospirota bacterium]
MKKTILIVAIALLLAGGTAVYAFGPMGFGYGHMGYGSGYTTTTSPEYQKFLDETATLRKELNSKRFELRELYRQRTPDTAKITALQKEIVDLEGKIQEKAEKFGSTATGWYDCPMHGYTGGGMMGGMMHGGPMGGFWR